MLSGSFLLDILLQNFFSSRSWSANLQESCTQAGAEMTRSGLDSASTIANFVHACVFTSVTSPGRDWHEVVVKRCHLYPVGRWREADLNHGGACCRVRSDTHSSKRLALSVCLFLKHRCIVFSLSEKSTPSSQVTPTCRELNRSDGATGSWGETARAITAASPAGVSLPSCLISVTPWPWAEMWTHFRRWRKESTCYLSAGKRRACRAHLTPIPGHFRRLLLPHSGAIAGTPFDIDRELLRKGQSVEGQIILVLSDL